MVNIFETISKFLNVYNEISEKKLSSQEFITIFPKFSLILNNFSLDILEMIKLTDVLLEFKNNNQLDKINNETIELIKKITNSKLYNLEGSLYLSILIKHMLISFDINKCEKEYDTILHISRFETLLELITMRFQKNDYDLLQKYNSELSELVLQYKKNIDLYKTKIKGEIILSMMISHLYSIFYFNQLEYDNDYNTLDLMVNNLINNYQQFINYCYNEGIVDNFSKIILEPDEIKKEYSVSKKMLDYTFDNLNKKKK